MAKLIGTDPNQVPSNADLGTAAYSDIKDFLSSKGSNLNAINTVISRTATDVFVYDTSLDSDGGAWRYKTHNSSWYNEKLNTHQRGTRREFPAVAVLVLEQTRLTIYDADDANLPMWMVFETKSGSSGYAYSILSNCSLSSTCAMNGQIVVTDNGNAAGTYLLNFIPDYTRRIGNSTTAGTTGVKDGGIAARNTVTHYDHKNEVAMRDWYANACDITVLPDAPIDPETGIPKTTVAVGMNNGVTFLTHDGTAVDIDGTSQGESVTSVTFTNDGRVVYCHGYACVYANIPGSDDVAAYYNQTSTYINRISNTTSHIGVGNPAILGSLVSDATALKHDAFAVSGNTSTSGFSIVENMISGDTFRQAVITPNYNTGWINGEVATVLAPANDLHVHGGELVVNSTFDSNTNNWFTVDANNSITWNGGNMEVYRGGSGSSDVAGSVLQKVMKAGVKYVIRVDVVQDGGSGNQLVRLGSGVSSYDRDVPGTTGTGVKYVTYTPTVDIQSIWIYAYPNQTTIVNTVSVSIAEEDRGKYSDDFQVLNYNSNSSAAHTATLRKHYVAKGCDTAAYILGGTDGGENFLSCYQDTNIGTGDFSVSFWIYPLRQGTGYFHAISRAGSPLGNGQSSTTGFTLKFDCYTSSVGWIPYFYSGTGGANSTYTGNTVCPLEKWTHVIGQRRAGRWEIYANGERKITGSTNAFSITEDYIIVGRGSSSEFEGDCRMALIRHTLDSVTDDQARKIYEDERHLFVENAKGKMYGDDGSVEAIAYDKVQDALHVGNAYGRSVFSGLVRKAYDTKGITTGISAQDGLVAEE
jgi:hypothetical protein